MEKNINSKIAVQTERLSDSILMLVNEILNDSKSKTGIIKSVSKYNGLGEITTKQNSYIERSNYVMEGDKLTISLNYSHLVNKYQSDIERSSTYSYYNTNVNSYGEFDDSLIDYEYLNRLLAIYNITVKREKGKITNLKYATLNNDVLIITYEKKKEIKKEKNTEQEKINEILDNAQKRNKQNNAVVSYDLFDEIDFNDLIEKLKNTANNSKKYVIEEIKEIRNKLKKISSLSKKYYEFKKIVKPEEKKKEESGVTLSNLVDKLNISENTKKLLKSYMSPYLKTSFSDNAKIEDITNYIYNIMGVLPIDDKTSNVIKKELLDSIKVEEENKNYVTDFINNLPLDDSTKKLLKWWLNNLKLPTNMESNEVKKYILSIVDKLPISEEVKNNIKNILNSDDPKLKRK